MDFQELGRYYFSNPKWALFYTRSLQFALITFRVESSIISKDSNRKLPNVKKEND